VAPVAGVWGASSRPALHAASSRCRSAALLFAAGAAASRRASRCAFWGHRATSTVAASAAKKASLVESDEVSLHTFKVGQQLEGTVIQIYCPSGVSVDVGCAECLGFLEVEEFRDGFPFEGPFSFKPGDQVTVRVLDLNPNAKTEDHGEPDARGDHGDCGKLHLTRRSGDLNRPSRYVADHRKPANLKPFLTIDPKEWIEGEVVMMSSAALIQPAFTKLPLGIGLFLDVNPRDRTT
ncbi:unnamed protein product, partial [Polarella glacialis]